MKNCISRRSFLKAAGILGAAGALAACGGSSSTSTAASSTASSAAASAAGTGASIKLWTYPIGGWGNDETVQNLISSFNAKYPDIKVTVEYLDYTNGDDQVNTAIEGGSAPDLVMEGPERLVANWGAKGAVSYTHLQKVNRMDVLAKRLLQKQFLGQQSVLKRMMCSLS